MGAGALEDLRCPMCHVLLAQRLSESTDGPVWIKCRKCGYMVRFTPHDAVIVRWSGD